jgi:hypothetical protein
MRSPKKGQNQPRGGKGDPKNAPQQNKANFFGRPSTYLPSSHALRARTQKITMR